MTDTQVTSGNNVSDALEACEAIEIFLSKKLKEALKNKGGVHITWEDTQHLIECSKLCNAALASQNSPDLRDKEVCFSKDTNNEVLEALDRIKSHTKDYGAFSVGQWQSDHDLETIRQALLTKTPENVTKPGLSNADETYRDEFEKWFFIEREKWKEIGVELSQADAHSMQDGWQAALDMIHERFEVRKK